MTDTARHMPKPVRCGVEAKPMAIEERDDLRDDPLANMPYREARPLLRRRLLEAGVRPRKVERRLRVVDAIMAAEMGKRRKRLARAARRGPVAEWSTMLRAGM